MQNQFINEHLYYPLLINLNKKKLMIKILYI